jgi:transketolase
MNDTQRLAIDAIRVLSMDAVQHANSGHPGTPMALAPVGYELFRHHLRHNPADPEWLDRDRFILSVGHASMLLYSLLHLSGYEVSEEDIRNFRQWGSPTAGHPEYGHVAGAETTTGPLGQGVANSVGFAMAERWLAQRFNRPGHDVVDHFTYALCSDGDIMEGVSHEAAAIAGHQKLGRLIWIWDDNRITIEGDTDLSTSTDEGARFEAYGWHVLRVEDGNDLAAIGRALEQARDETERPTFIVLRTTIAYGSPGKAGTAASHGAPLGADEIQATKKNLGYPSLEPFHVTDDARSDSPTTRVRTGARAAPAAPTSSANGRNASHLTGASIRSSPPSSSG